MSRTIKCVMLGDGAEGLDYAPYPGDLGQRITHLMVLDMNFATQ